MRVLQPRAEPEDEAEEDGEGSNPHLRALAAHRRAARGAYAHETERKLRSGSAAFLDWCSSRGLPALPAAPSTLAAYVDALHGRAKAATVASHVWAVGALHRAAGLPDPARDPAVALALRRFRRANGVAQRQAAPLGEREVAAVLATSRGQGLLDLRDRALLLAARDTLCRRRELAELRVEDLAWNPDGTGSVVVRRSKTDQEGRGRAAHLDRAAAAAVRAWLLAAGVEVGPVFRGVRGRATVCGPLDGGAVARAFKRLAARAGLDAARVSGHSTRVGTAVDLVADGASLPELMLAGNWKDAAMPARYAARGLAGRNAVARWHAKRRRD